MRWSDIDANKHLGNSSYVDYMSNTRMSFFTEQGLDLDELNRFGLGPIVFYEHIYYFKEILLGDAITVSLEVSGYSEDGRFIMFEHNFYNGKGENIAYCEMQGGWIDLKLRRLTPLPDSLIHLTDQFPKSKNFKVLTKEDTRKHGIRPKPLET